MSHKTVLVASSHLWDWSFKAGMHYLTEYFIDRGYKVGFITIPFSLLSFASTYSRKNRVPGLIKVWLRGGQKRDDDMFIWYAPLTIFHPTPKMPTLLSFLNNKQAVERFLRFSVPPLKFWLRRWGFNEPDLLMFESGESMTIFKLIQAKKTIYRVSDNPEDLGEPSGLLDLECEIVKKADIILPVSRPIYDILAKKRGTEEGVYLLRNGVDINLFKGKTSVPEEYGKITKPRAIYVGSTGSGLFDFNLLFYAAKELPKVSFVIIGPHPQTFSDNKIPSNVYFLGGRPHSQLAGYLQHADVGLIPFKDVNILNALERPLKFYEYLASGLPVVSVDHGSLKAMRPYAILAKTYGDFVVAVQSALNVSQEYKSSLCDVAERFSWAKIYSQFETILIKHGILSPTPKV